MANFAGRKVLITGAAGGIGSAMAETFAEAGASLILVDIIDPSELASRLGSQHCAYQLDITNAGEIAEIVSKIGEECGIDVLINNAGYGVVFPADETKLDEWDKTMTINLRGPWLLAAAALPYLKKSAYGRVVNIASQAGVIALTDHAAYGASKAGLIGLTKVLALEWARYGITVNAISPTVVETPMALVGWSGEKGEKAKAEIPMGRFVAPKEVAEAALFLASENAGMITGDNMMLDGGFTIQ